ncbi:MAG: hypothetical protein GAK34_03344 [Delftia tsuruhatensis]|nr:MAG: hypothetical protein GAK34_03344 [Delftia tsuruhatensis]
MITAEPTMTNLFDQLGLDSSPEGIKQFILSHRLEKDTLLVDAPFWTDAQRALFSQQLHADATRALVVDQLSEDLHAEADLQAAPSPAIAGHEQEARP